MEDFEVNLPSGSKGLISLYDYETGDDILLDLSKWASYNKAMKQKLTDIKYRLNRIGIDMLTITPKDNFPLKINTFMKSPR